MLHQSLIDLVDNAMYKFRVKGGDLVLRRGLEANEKKTVDAKKACSGPTNSVAVIRHSWDETPSELLNVKWQAVTLSTDKLFVSFALKHATNESNTGNSENLKVPEGSRYVWR